MATQGVSGWISKSKKSFEWETNLIHNITCEGNKPAFFVAGWNIGLVDDNPQTMCLLKTIIEKLTFICIHSLHTAT